MTVSTVPFNQVLAPTTSGATSSSFSLSNDGASLTIICIGLAGSETAKVQIFNPLDSTYYDYTPSGGIVQMTASINTVNLVNTHGIFQVVKSSTVASVGVTVQQSR